MSYSRSEAKERMLLAEAERLLAQRKQPLSRRGVVNQHHLAPPPRVPTQSEQATATLTQALQKRLLARDANGGGSGGPG